MTAIEQDLTASAAVHSVSSLTSLIRQNLVESFPFLWVRGEVTDFSISASRHLYFSLRDSEALLQCVWFAGKRKKADQGRSFDPLTGEVYDTPPPPVEELLKNGLEIVCAGSLNVYPRSGRYQLVVEHAEPAGLGMAALVLEKRRAKFEAAGYFDSARKKKLPSLPVRIALVTSPRGAAIHDFLKLASLRGLSAQIRLFPVTVQGKGAAIAMAAAINEINRQNEAQVIVLARGGGSREDLSEFNEEILVEAIYASHIPVLTGIGHEIDTSLADLVADVRAATPSHAAQILWPLRSDMWQTLDELFLALTRRMSVLFEKNSMRLSHAEKNLSVLSPSKKLEIVSARRASLFRAMSQKIAHMLDNRAWQCVTLGQRLKSAGAFAEKLEKAQAKIKQLDTVRHMWGKKFLDDVENRLKELEQSLHGRYREKLGSLEREAERLAISLNAANPYNPLARGYAFCQMKGKIIHSVEECKAGDEIIARFCDGELLLKILRIKNLPSICGQTREK